MENEASLQQPIVKQVKQKRIKIPAGEFVMGSTVKELQRFHADLCGWPSSCVDRERPQHTVMIHEFEIDKYPVTCWMYAEFCNYTGQHPPEYWKGNQPPEKLINHPVVYISILEAKEYCKWAGGRLPYETEWEKAARGRYAQIYPWGDEFECSKANVDKEGDERITSSVDNYPEGASPYGIMDMVGNVHEWTNDVLTPYPNYSVEKWSNENDAIQIRHFNANGVSTNPVFLTNMSSVRGGSFDTVRGLCRCASRIEMAGDDRMPNVGFRCVYAQDPNQMGLPFFNSGETDKALRYFKKALILSPAHAGILYNAAYCFQSVGEYQRAIQLWQQLIDLWPNDRDAVEMLEQCKRQEARRNSNVEIRFSRSSDAFFVKIDDEEERYMTRSTLLNEELVENERDIWQKACSNPKSDEPPGGWQRFGVQPNIQSQVQSSEAAPDSTAGKKAKGCCFIATACFFLWVLLFLFGNLLHRHFGMP
jgi:formylglycine-generating enzyme required for sulfatase activity